jgi:anti-anti-sigma factor
MALRLLRGVFGRPTPSSIRFAAGNGDEGIASVFSMTESRTNVGAVCLSLSGDIDVACRDSLRNRLIAMIDIDHVDYLAVDLDRVTFLDCSGIGALICGYNAALAAGCRYEVRNPHGIVGTILRICGVDEVLPIDPTTPPAAASFAA